MLAVFLKEMRETMRDRRTVIAAIVMPAVVMPVLLLALPAIATRQEAAIRDRPARIAVEGGDPTGLVALGFDERAFTLVSTPAPREALQGAKIDAVLTIEGVGPRTVVVLYDGARPASRAAVQKVQRIAALMALRELEKMARAQGLEASQVVPVVVEPRAVGDTGGFAGTILGTVLPFFLAIWLLLGGQYAALDAGVGERERGSLDALLATPPARGAIVAGKFLAVLTPAMLAAVIMLLSSAASVRIGAPLLGQGTGALLPAGVLLSLVALGAGLGALVSALQVLVSVASRTLREAQQAFTGLYFLVAFPLMLAPLTEDLVGRAWPPLAIVMNALVAFRDAFSGRSDGARTVLVTAGLILLSLPFLAVAAQVLEGQRRPKA